MARRGQREGVVALLLLQTHGIRMCCDQGKPEILYLFAVSACLIWMQGLR
jgi:hypothetical protein